MEIGCGTGFVLRGIHNEFPEVSLSGTEYLEEGLFCARKKVPSACLKKLNALDMNDHQKYDSIGAFDVIEHIENDGLALSNLAKALKRNGCLLITVPQHKWLWSVTDMNAGHFRRYSRKELIKKVTGTGLKVEFSTSFVSLLIPFMFLNRLFLNFKKTDQSEEFLISATLNLTLKSIMYVEILLIKYGIKIPLGGSLLLVARKPQ